MRICEIASALRLVMTSHVYGVDLEFGSPAFFLLCVMSFITTC